jgi:hypothetical protein
MREIDAQGIDKDSMRQFRAAWDQFSADPARLTEFLQAKRNRLGWGSPDAGAALLAYKGATF